MDDDKQKRPLDPSDFEDDLYDDEFAFDENDPSLASGDLADSKTKNSDLDDFSSEFEDTPENWGDFEDPALSATKPRDPAGPRPAAKKKSFVMKHFNTIVIALGVVLGGGVVLTQFMGAPPSQIPSDMTPEDTAQATSDVPAQPTDGALPQPSPIAQPAAAEQERLTPMPGQTAGADTGAQTPELAPLDPGPDLGLDDVGVKEGPADAAAPATPETVETTELAQLEPQPTPPTPIEGAVDVEKAPVELPDPIAFENQPIPTAAPPAQEETPVAAETENKSVTPPTEEPSTQPEQAAPIAPDTAAPADVAKTEEEIAPTPETPAEEKASETSLEPAVPIEEPETETAAPPADASNAHPVSSHALEKLNADNEGLASRNKELEQKVSEADSKIQELSAMLAEMEKKIAALDTAKTDVAAAEEPSEAAAPTEEKAKAPATETKPESVLVPAEPEVKAETAKPKPKKTPKISTDSTGDAPRWTLRSAQNGRAVVSDRSTGDLRSVEVGDTLRGIGKITSISTVNGRWVVKGSQGQINQ